MLQAYCLHDLPGQGEDFPGPAVLETNPVFRHPAEIVIHGVHLAQGNGHGRNGRPGVGGDLIGSDTAQALLGGGADDPVDEQFRFIGVGSVLDQVDRTDFISRTFHGCHRFHRIPLFGVVDRVMKENNGHRNLSAAGEDPRGGTGLGVVCHVGVEFLHIIQAFLLSEAKNLGGQGGQGRSGSVGIGHSDEAFELGIDEIVPPGGDRYAQPAEEPFVYRKTQGSHVDADDTAVTQRVPETGVQLIPDGGAVVFRQPFLGGDGVRIGGSSPPDISLGIGLFRPQTGQGFTAGHSDPVYLHPGFPLILLS